MAYNKPLILILWNSIFEHGEKTWFGFGTTRYEDQPPWFENSFISVPIGQQMSLSSWDPQILLCTSLMILFLFSLKQKEKYVKYHDKDSQKKIWGPKIFLCTPLIIFSMKQNENMWNITKKAINKENNSPHMLDDLVPLLTKTEWKICETLRQTQWKRYERANSSQWNSKNFLCAP